MTFKIPGTRPALTRCRPIALVLSIVCLSVILSSTPLAAQDDPALVSVSLDKSHFYLHVFGNFDDPDLGWGISFDAPASKLDTSDIALEMDFDLRAETWHATLAGHLEHEKTSGETMQCTWHGVLDQDATVAYDGMFWRFSAKGQLNLQCTGQNSPADGVVSTEGEIAFPAIIEGLAIPEGGSQIALWLDDNDSLAGFAIGDPLVWWGFHLSHVHNAPSFGPLFPYPSQIQQQAPTATATRELPTATVTRQSATPMPACTPPPCGDGEVYHCPGECPGGCGTECATPTPSAPADPTSVPPSNEDDDPGSNGQDQGSGDDDKGGPRLLTGAAVAAAGTTAVAAMGVGAAVAIRRARAGKKAPSSAQPPDLGHMRAQWQERLSQAAHRVLTLESHSAQLKNRIADLETQWRVETATGVTDGVIDIADLFVSVVAPASSAAGAGAISALKDGLKLGGRALANWWHGGNQRIDLAAELRRISASGIGIPLAPGAPGGAIGQGLQDAGQRQYRRSIWRILWQHRLRNPGGMTRAVRDLKRIKALNRGLGYLGPAVSAVSAGQTAHGHAQRAATLRASLRQARELYHKVQRQLMDARADYDQARSALQSVNDNIAQLKAQFPNRFQNL